MTPLYGYVRLVCCILADNADDFFLAYGGTRHTAGTANAERRLWQYVSRPETETGSIKDAGKRRRTDDSE